ncbi:DNA internalization-related competence protein ComEC/Rec2 [Alteromonas aestuariivivens]|uniref:DNA internalization-related competence protein ComEC/Rec2 n=1 Tax=Alteromonas aestuariivivens TaxID=1938339 RepID=A0A3D8M8F4_9ALTE|nr:DNA internalization-related competence protein ComEC/Rec2 [Alteromonas aestuariivivens]RDV26094.1 DNA internalization-related competence protein ComEC/Rec2 [Alteromonas aestuariivivens]
MRYNTMIWLSGFILSAVSSVLWVSLPAMEWLCVALVILLLLSVSKIALRFIGCLPANRLFKYGKCSSRWPLWLSVGHGVLAGILWMASVGHLYLTWQLPEHKIRQDVVVKGQIDELELKNDKLHFTLSANEIDGQSLWFAKKIRLVWQAGERQLFRHQQVRLTARLRPPQGTANPAGSLAQQVLLSRAIVAVGEVQSDAEFRLVEPTDCIHFTVAAVIEQAALDNQRWLKALLVGDRSELTAADWQTLKVTGTAHLFSISGLHLGMVASSVLLMMVTVLVALQRLTGHFSPQHNLDRMLCLPLVIVTAAYAHLAGWQLPVTRAWVLLVAWLITSRYLGHWSLRHIALFMTSLCILLFPLSLFSASFYLSVGAVLLIWFCIWRFGLRANSFRQKCRALLILQLSLSIGLMPVTLLWFDHLSWLALPVNLMLVPVVSIFLPLALLVLLSGWLGFPIPWLWRGVDVFMGAIIRGLQWAEQWVGNGAAPLDKGAALAALLALGMICAPRLPFQRLGITLAFLPLLSQWLPANPERWLLHVADVGQGSALLISRGSRSIMVDTGRGFYPQGSYAQSTLIPLMAKLNIARLDLLMLSHGDDDHSGGKQAIADYVKRQGFSDFRVITNLDSCQRGLNFEWQGLLVRAIWPLAGNPVNDNHHSCVILIEDGEHRVLVPGDIDRSAEYALLAMKEELKADVIVAPHHGSASSSGNAFVRAVSPKYVVFTQGYLNQWGFPGREVVRRYRETGARVLTTSHDGYMRFQFHPTEGIKLQTYRRDIGPKWYLHRSNFPVWIEK